MHIQPVSWLQNHPDAKIARDIIRACVHCGFCNATCPTYQLLGDELDGPRGRIYQIKSLWEGAPATARIQTHLDRCLTCRACETTCPSGVRYGRLLDIGRGIVERQVKRPWHQRLLRRLLRLCLPYPRRLRPWYRLAQTVRPLIPALFKVYVRSGRAPIWPEVRHVRRMLVLDGCVQSVLAPDINAVTARILDRLGISLVRAPRAGCCGAMSDHLGAHDEGLAFMRRNIDAWWPWVEGGVEAIVMTASGCGVTVKEYGELLAHDPDYAAKAATVSALAKDLSEVMAEKAGLEALQPKPVKVAFQSPCTLQHGLGLAGKVESLLRYLGFELTPVADPHLCCGSAGTYSILQPKLARRLRRNKIAALERGDPDVIATANIGCLLHLRPAASRPVVHWIELLDQGSGAGRVKT
ncbi:MAG: glycolate oxidase subunit GlcF [Methylohalobius sp. ZOD2]